MRHLFIFIFLFICALSDGLNAQQTKTAVVGGKRYIGHLDEFHFFLLTSNGDTALNLRQESFFDFKFQDFNRDGFKDLYLDWGGNTSEKYNLYVFVPSTGKYSEIQNFSDFPDAKTIKGTRYYYSYSKAGCADYTWNSSLFYIKNSKAVAIGAIHGEGCGIKDGIYIYKVKSHGRTLLKTLPLNTIEKYKDYKWGFIKQYWTHNYSQFQ